MASTAFLKQPILIIEKAILGLKIAFVYWTKTGQITQNQNNKSFVPTIIKTRLNLFSYVLAVLGFSKLFVFHDRWFCAILILKPTLPRKYSKHQDAP